jgi:hypothetical protein
MPQTKHAFMFLAVATLVLVGGVFSVFTSSTGVVASLMGPQTALLIQAEEAEPEVEVSRDTTREDARANLMSELKAYVDDGDSPDGNAEVVGAITSPIIKEEVIALEQLPPQSPSHILCDPSAPLVSYPDWGPVNITLREGARVITSLASDASGVSAHTLALPLPLTVTGVTACLPNDMVAIALDGQVLTSAEPFSTMSGGLVGYAVDGFPLFGPYEEEIELKSKDLDVCHGHVHTIIDQGVPVSMYHYHVTTDAPYTLGCFRGTPVFE